MIFKLMACFNLNVLTQLSSLVWVNIVRYDNMCPPKLVNNDSLTRSGHNIFPEEVQNLYLNDF